MIAQVNGVSVQALAQANGITNTNLVYSGQKLVIPGGGAAATTGNQVVYGTTVPSQAGYGAAVPSQAVYGTTALSQTVSTPVAAQQMSSSSGKDAINDALNYVRKGSSVVNAAALGVGLVAVVVGAPVIVIAGIAGVATFAQLQILELRER
jgi:LysM repeat protein